MALKFRTSQLRFSNPRFAGLILPVPRPAFRRPSLQMMLVLLLGGLTCLANITSRHALSASRSPTVSSANLSVPANAPDNLAPLEAYGSLPIGFERNQ